MKWMDNPYRHTASDAEDLTYPPSGGRVKMILLGIVVPLVILYFGFDAWTTEEATWLGSRSSDIKVRGNTAKCVGVTYSSIGLFCHFRWFWGLIPVYRVFEIGMVVSLLGILGGILFGAYYLFE